MTGYLGLGSNVGDRAANLRAARNLLGQDVEVLASSSLYETEPQGEVLDQPDFLNACLRIETDLSPDDVLAVCKQVERDLGRAAGPRHGPRPIDVDLLLLGDITRESPQLTLPHPELHTRRFVVDPLLELDPGLRLPDGTALADVQAAVQNQRVERIGPFGGR